MTTACLRRHFDTLQSTGNGSSLLELQRAPNALSLLQALLQEELAQEPPPVAPPAVLLMGTQMLQKCLRRCPLEAAAGIEALLLPALTAATARRWRPIVTQIALALAVLLIRQTAWPESTLLSQLLAQLSGESLAIERTALVALLTLLAEELTSLTRFHMHCVFDRWGGVPRHIDVKASAWNELRFFLPLPGLDFS